MNELEKLKERLEKHIEMADHRSIREPLELAVEGIDNIVEDSGSLRSEAKECAVLLIKHYDKTKNISERCDSLKIEIKELQENLKEKASCVDRETKGVEYSNIQDRRISVGDDLMKLNMIDVSLLPCYVTLNIAPLIIGSYISFDDEYFQMLLPEKEKVLPGYPERTGKAIRPLFSNIPIVGNIMSVIESASRYMGFDDLKSTKSASGTINAVDNMNSILLHWVSSCPQYVEEIKNVKSQIQDNIDEMDSASEQLSLLEKMYRG